MYRKITTAVLIIGIIIVLIGGYYIITNAGMSYSDNTTEDILIEYQENLKKGINLIKTGMVVTMIGLMLRYKNRILRNYTEY